VPALRDTSKTHILDELATRPAYSSEYDINKKSFYSKYAFDTTSRQIIDTHFSKRNKYIMYMILPLLIMWVLTIPIAFLMIITGIYALYILVLLMYAAVWALRIYGLVKLIQLKKLDLLYELVAYRKTGNSPFGKKPIPTKSSTDDYYELK
jgi:hypothetical protein